MKVYKEKIGTGLFIFLLSLLMHYLTATQIKEASLAGVSPRAIPYLVARCIMLLSLVMMGQGGIHFLLEKKQDSPKVSDVHFQAFPLHLFVLILAYAIVMNFAGYFIASFTILPLMMYVLKVRKPSSYAVLAGLVVFVFVIIDILLKIRLPKIGLFGII